MITDSRWLRAVELVELYADRKYAASAGIGLVQWSEKAYDFLRSLAAQSEQVPQTICWVIEHGGGFYVDGFGYGTQADGSVGPDKYNEPDAFENGFGAGFRFPTRELAKAAAIIADLSRTQGYENAKSDVRKMLGLKE